MILTALYGLYKKFLNIKYNLQRGFVMGFIKVNLNLFLVTKSETSIFFKLSPYPFQNVTSFINNIVVKSFYNFKKGNIIRAC